MPVLSIYKVIRLLRQVMSILWVSLLYEILTGIWPYDRSQKKQGWDVKQIVCEEEPESPSDALKRYRIERKSEIDGDRSTLEEISKKRTTPPGNLTKVLTGDLSAIVMKAIRKESTQRYSSTEQFSADIERFQKNLPVDARKGTFRYLAAKFIKRNWKTVMVAVLFVSTLVGGIVGTTFGMFEANEAQAIAEEKSNCST